MKRTLLAGLIATAALAAGCNNDTPATSDSAKLESVDQRVSYLFGLNLAQQFKHDDVPLDVDAFTLAIRDVQGSVDPRLSDEDMKAAMKAFQDKQVAKHEESQKVVAEANQKQGEDFLAENKTKEGVVETASGLQYKVITEGTGKQPTPEDLVTVHYRGTLIDGTEFDSSYARGEPVTFPLSGVIPGWIEGLQLMKEGGKAELYIPSALAYGPGGTQGAIGPNATLIFEVELIKVGGDSEDAAAAE